MILRTEHAFTTQRSFDWRGYVMLAARIVLIFATAFLMILTWQLKGWKRTGSWIILVVLVVLQLYQLYQDARKEHAGARSGKMEAAPVTSPNLSLYYGSRKTMGVRSTHLTKYFSQGIKARTF